MQWSHLLALFLVAPGGAVLQENASLHDSYKSLCALNSLLTGAPNLNIKSTSSKGGRSREQQAFFDNLEKAMSEYMESTLYYKDAYAPRAPGKETEIWAALDFMATRVMDYPGYGICLKLRTNKTGPFLQDQRVCANLALVLTRVSLLKKAFESIKASESGRVTGPDEVALAVVNQLAWRAIGSVNAGIQSLIAEPKAADAVRENFAKAQACLDQMAEGLRDLERAKKLNEARFQTGFELAELLSVTFVVEKMTTEIFSTRIFAYMAEMISPYGIALLLEEFKRLVHHPVWALKLQFLATFESPLGDAPKKADIATLVEMEGNLDAHCAKLQEISTGSYYYSFWNESCPQLHVTITLGDHPGTLDYFGRAHLAGTISPAKARNLRAKAISLRAKYHSLLMANFGKLRVWRHPVSLMHIPHTFSLPPSASPSPQVFEARFLCQNIFETFSYNPKFWHDLAQLPTEFNFLVFYAGCKEPLWGKAWEKSQFSNRLEQLKPLLKAIVRLGQLATASADAKLLEGEQHALRIIHEVNQKIITLHRTLESIMPLFDKDSSTRPQNTVELKRYVCALASLVRFKKMAQLCNESTTLLLSRSRLNLAPADE